MKRKNTASRKKWENVRKFHDLDEVIKHNFFMLLWVCSNSEYYFQWWHCGTVIRIQQETEKWKNEETYQFGFTSQTDLQCTIWLSQGNYP